MIGVFIIIALILIQQVKDRGQEIKKRYNALSFSDKKRYAEEMRK